MTALRLGEWLVEKGWIDATQRDRALQVQAQKGQKLGQILLFQQAINESQLSLALAAQLGIHRVDLQRLEIDPQVVNRLSEAQSQCFQAIVYGQCDDKWLVAMVDPTDLRAQEGLFSALNGDALSFALCDAQQWQWAMARYYRRTQAIQTFAAQLRQEQQEHAVSAFAMESHSDEEATLTKLILSLFEDALRIGASDIHIEPDDGILRVRQRVDGRLQEMLLPDPTISSALVLRLKLMSGLDIAEKRLPQDGRFPFSVLGKTLDVRLSTLPLAFGEAVVMRLLDPSSDLLSLEKIGLNDSTLLTLKTQLNRPHGLILVTGPTGSGKTTTLYGALNALNRPETKMITVEDPVEYRLPRINQVQVNSKIGLDFAQVLRSVLRQDPDVLLIGEMRDQETVETGLRAALTGHLVLSTLHTNRAVDAPLRLMDMGAAGYLVASSLNAIVAQRLVRRVCPHCQKPAILSEEDRAWYRTHFGGDSGSAFVQGEGCGHCHFSGYRGRIGVFECLVLTEPMRQALRQNDTQGFLQAVALTPDFISMTQGAMALACDGITTFDEVRLLCDGMLS